MGALRLLSLFILLSVFPLQGQDDEERVLAWSSERRLTWKDYQGSPLKTEWASATTASGITYSLSSVLGGNEPRLEVNVMALFYPDKSWYKPELCDEVVLSHEQLHFDITELYARKFRERLKTVRNDENVKKSVRSIFVEINKELNAFQNKYDRETNFSRNIPEQLAWNKKISEVLKGDE